MEEERLLNRILGKTNSGQKYKNKLRNDWVLIIALPYRFLSDVYLARRFKYFKTVQREVRKEIKQLSNTVEKQGRCLTQCVNALRNFQLQIGKVLNHELERHALNPAIKTAVVLHDEIINLKTIAEKAKQEAKDCPIIQPLLNSLQISACIAEDKLAYLDIEKITASEGDDLDPQKHHCCNSIKTNDGKLHGKVSKLMAPGLIYRGKVLRQAKVSVFCYSDGVVRPDTERSIK